ncbi:Histidine kinase [Peptoniphilus sp. ING2-D1G]|nr:Histidine kinase [Peptoniphilus sp. ING2-D1G]
MSRRISYFDYVKLRISYLFMCILMGVVFFVVLYSRNINVSSIFYALLISFAVLFLCSLYFYGRYKLNYLSLIDFLNSDEINLKVDFSDPVYKLLAQGIRDYKIQKTNFISDDRKRLDEINKFYTMWTHQIKTPIAALNLMLEDKNESDLKIEVMKIEDYVNMLLAYYRNNSPTTDYSFSKVRLDDVIRSSVRKYADVFIKNKIKIKVDLKEAVVISDSKWLEFIISQLISNSLKYTKSGEITIISAENFISIKDTGIGIEKSDLPRIFELGFTGYNGRIYTKSTGIGLNLVKSVADNLNIDIEVDSNVGEGTTVKLKFNNRILQ